ncbi:hypothetical protein DL96DRAFT_1669054 [Flagelloscypha sp. PMI_526]|nr:hypothetical protein DL96DRAFT_1669054 [Flagelloscypha sp. PMI_526]
MLFGKKKWDPKGLHVYVTGGSQGLGLSVAIQLAQKGANVSIVARRKEQLDVALKQIEAARVSPEQKFNAYSHSLGTYKESKEAFEAVISPYGGAAPDAIFTCAGKSVPAWWVDMTEQSMSDGMMYSYWVQAWTAMLASHLMVKQRKSGKLVFVSSVVGLMSFQGYCSYAPGKTAIRALSETLEQELRLYDIGVSCYFPATIYSPGFEEELAVKPGPQRKIEEADGGITPDKAATVLLKGVQAHKPQITGDLITNLFRSSTRGGSRHDSWFLDFIYDLIGFVAIPIWRWSADKVVMDAREEHLKDLEARGFFEPLSSK